MEATQATGVSRTPIAIVARTDKDFVDGVCSGYVTYFHEYQQIPLSDRDLYTFPVKESRCEGFRPVQCLLHWLD